MRNRSWSLLFHLKSIHRHPRNVNWPFEWDFKAKFRSLPLTFPWPRRRYIRPWPWSALDYVYLGLDLVKHTAWNSKISEGQLRVLVSGKVCSGSTFTVPEKIICVVNLNNIIHQSDSRQSELLSPKKIWRMTKAIILLTIADVWKMPSVRRTTIADVGKMPSDDSFQPTAADECGSNGVTNGGQWCAKNAERCGDNNYFSVHYGTKVPRLLASGGGGRPPLVAQPVGEGDGIPWTSD